jgi:hypothetical protein
MPGTPDPSRPAAPPPSPHVSSGPPVHCQTGAAGTGLRAPFCGAERAQISPGRGAKAGRVLRRGSGNCCCCREGQRKLGSQGEGMRARRGGRGGTPHERRGRRGTAGRHRSAAARYKACMQACALSRGTSSCARTRCGLPAGAAAAVGCGHVSRGGTGRAARCQLHAAKAQQHQTPPEQQAACVSSTAAVSVPSIGCSTRNESNAGLDSPP